MLGQHFWTTFTNARIPEAELIALGEDIGYKKDAASAMGNAALLKLGYAMGRIGAKATASQIFEALKAEMPGLMSRKSLLEGLASDYGQKATYQTLSDNTRNYIDAVARHLPNAVAQPQASVGASAPAKAASGIPTQGPKAPQSTASAPASAPANSPVPKGLSETEWNFLRAVVSKLSSGQGAKVSANNLASARNLAARANLKIVEAFDAEIAARGDGAQDPDGSPAPSAESTQSRFAGMGPVLGLVAFLFLFLFKR